MSGKKTIRDYINKLEEDEDNYYNIEFEQPTTRIEGETYFKCLSPDSEFFLFLTDCNYKLKHAGIRFTTSDAPCVNILQRNERGKSNELELFLKRVDYLQGKIINVYDPNNYKMIGNKILVLCLPSKEEIGLKDPYIQIAKVDFLSNKERFLKILLNKEYTTENNWEFTVFD
jgi:hypothetical protein